MRNLRNKLKRTAKTFGKIVLGANLIYNMGCSKPEETQMQRFLYGKYEVSIMEKEGRRSITVEETVNTSGGPPWTANEKTYSIKGIDKDGKKGFEKIEVNCYGVNLREGLAKLTNQEELENFYKSVKKYGQKRGLVQYN